ncbi:MAG: type II CRISPR-associated endonuclease Cas1 [Candidatus Spyradosoma sp.]
MSYHIITVESPTAELDCVHGQFVCVSPTGTQSLPLDDVGAVIVCCFSAKIEMRLLTEAAKRGVGIILCEMFKPACIVLPAIRSTDTLLTRTWEKANPKFLKELWQKTLDAKCHNQWLLASVWEPRSPAVAAMEIQKFQRFRAREGSVSRLFWSVFRKHAGEDAFLRSRGEGEINSLLDYGYSVLLARVLQLCYACGLDPTFGIGHAVAERSTPLAYDLMEPFRPLVDARVMSWLKGAATRFEVGKAYKAHLLQFLQEKISYAGALRQAQTVMEISIHSFRKSLLEKELPLYEPWIAVDSKWAGC